MDKRPETVGIRRRQRESAGAGLDQLGGAADDRVDGERPLVVKENQFGDGAGDDTADSGRADGRVDVVITPQDTAQAKGQHI